MDSRRAPERIGLSHSYDESPDLAAYARASCRGASGESGPVLAEAAALPPRDGVGRHDDKGLPPAGPPPGQRDPEQPIAAEQLRPVHHLLVDGELVAQSKVLQGDLTVAAAEHREESKQVPLGHEPRDGTLGGVDPQPQKLPVNSRGTPQRI